MIVEIEILALTVEAYPKSYYSLQGIEEEGPFTAYVTVVGGHIITTCLIAIMINRSAQHSVSPDIANNDRPNSFAYGFFLPTFCLLINITFILCVGLNKIDGTKYGMLLLTTNYTLIS